jgi:effector-binding domain-containing protein
LIQGNEGAVAASWKRLLEQLAVENETVKQRGPDIIPQIQFKDLQNPSQEFIADIKKRGVAVIRGVVPENEARGYKNEVEEYVKLNPWTKGTFLSTFL